MCVCAPSSVIPVPVTQPLYPAAEEQRGRAWLSLVRTEPPFFSPAFRLNHKLLLWLNKAENPADTPFPSTLSREVITPARLVLGSPCFSREGSTPDHRDLCCWCCGQEPIRDQLPHAQVQRSFTPAHSIHRKMQVTFVPNHLYSGAFPCNLLN